MPDAPTRRSVLLATVLAVLLLAAAAIVVGVRLASDDEGAPVLLVYGYGGTTDDLQPLAGAMSAAGRDVTLVELPDNNTGDLRESATVLDDTAQQVRERTGTDRVDVVAHSAGGVVTRLWASEVGPGVIRRVVTLGSPHHGSDGAAVFDPCLEACQQLLPGSDLLDELAAIGDTPGDASWVSVWSENDGAVDPPSSSELDGALNIRLQDVCADATTDHVGLLTDALPLGVAVAEILADDPVELGPDDCGRLSRD